MPAPDDGLSATTVHGAPDPDEWPAALFVYGTLQPGHPAWPLLAGHTVGRPRRATVAGRVCDTGLGYPALLPDGADRAPGWLVTCVDPPFSCVGSTATRDDEYRRIRVAAMTDDGPRTACWTYAWTADEGAIDPGPRGLDSVIEVSQHETPVTVGAP